MRRQRCGRWSCKQRTGDDDAVLKVYGLCVDLSRTSAAGEGRQYKQRSSPRVPSFLLFATTLAVDQMGRTRWRTPQEGNTGDQQVATSVHRPHMGQCAARSRGIFEQLPSASFDPPQCGDDRRHSTSPGWGEDKGPAGRPGGCLTDVRTLRRAPACGRFECPDDAHSRSAPNCGGATRRGQALGLHWGLRMLLILLLLRQADGWIALSNKGYEVKHGLVAQAGVKVQGEVDVNGLIISKPVARLQCNPSRRGAIRWDDKAFEGCDGETDWKPLTFCSRSCTINTDSVPCGLPVRNRCDKSCNQVGTGMNMRQCILNVAVTPCQHVVRDLCGNACGLEGQMNCESLHKDVGKMILKSTVRNTNESQSAAYELGMRGMNHGNFDNGLFWTYTEKDAAHGEDMVVFQKLEETSDPPKFVPPKGPSDKKEIKEKPHGKNFALQTLRVE